jgi:aldose sugar dehydrogenase
MNRLPLITALALLTAACQSGPIDAKPAKDSDRPFATEVMADFDEPWAMTFLPGSKDALITEKKGKLLLWRPGLGSFEVQGAPKVDYGGQGGLGDVIVSPSFEKDRIIYLSWVEAGEKGTHGAVVGRAALLDGRDGKPSLGNLQIIWKQFPKEEGRGHFSHRLAFSPDGKYLFIGSGERQKFDPAQDMATNLGKIVRLLPDGKTPNDNPFAERAYKITRMHVLRPGDAERAEMLNQIWSLGHRNILGLAFDDKGQLWNQEMGPQGGDELNLVKPAANYGYPKVSNGDHYDGRDIPDHAPGDGFEAPKLWWNPAISPAGLMYYTGAKFPKWKGSMFIGGLGAKSLVRVTLNGNTATKADEWPMGARIREVEQAPDGTIWLLEDGKNGSEGRMLRLTPTLDK